MQRFKLITLSWLPLVVLITGLCGLIMVTVQQNYRQTFNDPQIQMAEDAAYAIQNGAAITTVEPGPSLLPNTHIEMSESLAPWLAYYDKDGQVLTSSGYLFGALPKLPQGVFDRATWRGSKEYRIPLATAPNETRFTWESKNGVRQAVVLVYVPETHQYVASGRNMRELENRAQTLLIMVALAWAVTMLASFVVVGAGVRPLNNAKIIV